MSNSEFTVVRPCSKCGDTERYKGGQCKACAVARSAAWAAANPDKRKAMDAARRAANPDKQKAQHAAWRAANPCKIKANNAAWAKANPEKVKAQTAAWREANKDNAKAYAAAWSAANPDKVRINAQNRRALKKKAGGKLSRGLAATLFKLQKGKCPCCKRPLGNNYHLDHIVPLVLGGSNTDGNVQLLRSTCNMQKNKKHPVDFMQSRGFLL